MKEGARSDPGGPFPAYASHIAEDNSLVDPTHNRHPALLEMDES
jgi:hypothetical protein